MAIPDVDVDVDGFSGYCLCIGTPVVVVWVLGLVWVSTGFFNCGF